MVEKKPAVVGRGEPHTPHHFLTIGRKIKRTQSNAWLCNLWLVVLNTLKCINKKKGGVVTRVQITRRIKKETNIVSHSRPLPAACALGLVCKPGGILNGGGSQGEGVLFKFGSRGKIKAPLFIKALGT